MLSPGTALSWKRSLSLIAGPSARTLSGMWRPFAFSLAGTRNLKWATAALVWAKLPNLVGLDLSRTDASPYSISRLLSLSKSLKVLCVLNCSLVQEEWKRNQTAFSNAEGEAGTALLLSLVKCSQEDVQEKAAAGLATFVVTDDENAAVDPMRAEAVMRNGGIPFASGACTDISRGPAAIANLSVNAKVAKAVAKEGGIGVLANLARSMNRFVAEEAAGGLWNLSVGEEHKRAKWIKALVDLIFRWPAGTDGVLERAAGALANLSADDKCSMDAAAAGAARALANLAAHGDNNTNNAAVEAAGALWNLSFDDGNREAIAAVGGVAALVALAQACTNASRNLQERAAGALWGLSVSEANSIAIGQEGGVAPLIALARSNAEDVHETAVGALWNLAYNPGNALRIVEEGGVTALVHLCSSSRSKMARFMSALALSYMFDGRQLFPVGSSSEGIPKGVNLDAVRRIALRHIEDFVQSYSDPQLFSMVVTSSTSGVLTQIGEAARILEAGHLRCSCAEIGRFVSMLLNTSPIIRSCAAFALLQFTIPGSKHALHHLTLLQRVEAGRVLRKARAAISAPIEAKVFSKVVGSECNMYKLTLDGVDVMGERLAEEWEDSLCEKYPHIVYEEKSEGKNGNQYAQDSNGEEDNCYDVLEEELVTGLSRVSWERVDVSFHTSRLRFAAHSVIQ
ncbi:hypothetical protein J5N97_000621, partial [Dioscorea zingiberensis]